MNTYPTVFCIDSSNWETPWWVDRHYLMLGLASRGWPVVFSNGPISVWDIREKNRYPLQFFGRVEAWLSDRNSEILLDRPGLWMLSWPKFLAYNALAHRVHARRLVRSVPEGSLKNAIAFLCAPQFADYGTYLDLPHTVYHIHDAYWMRGNWNDRAQAEHDRLAERADLIFALSDTMLRNLPASAMAKASVLPQAVYAEEYIAKASDPCPADLQDIPQPRIGYMGRISRKVDLEMVGTVAKARPNWHWVFVGEVGVGFRDDAKGQALLEKTSKLPNVHILGARAQNLMPAYMGNMDVNTMCYLAAGGQWEAGNPLKMFEYLAVGKPVIGAGLENVRRYSHVIDIPETTDEWISAIERALERGGVGSIAERREVALQNTWEKVVDELEAKLLQLIGR